MEITKILIGLGCALLFSACTAGPRGSMRGSLANVAAHTPGKAVRSAASKEERVRQYAKYLYPGLTLGDANRLLGWRADFRAGNWFWTDTGTLLVQTTLSQDIDADPRILEVFDFYRNLRMQWDQESQSIIVTPIPTVGSPEQ